MTGLVPVVALVVTVQVLPQPWQQGPSSTFEQVYARAWDAFEQDRYGRAITLLMVARQRWPRHRFAPFAWYMEARLREWNGDATGATATMRSFLKAYPDDPNAPWVRQELAFLDRLLATSDHGLVSRWLGLMAGCAGAECGKIIDFVKEYPQFEGNGRLASCARWCILSSRGGLRLARYLPPAQSRVYVRTEYVSGRVRDAMAIAQGRVKALILLDLLLRAWFLLFIAWLGFSRRRSDPVPLDGALAIGSVVLAMWRPESFGLAYVTSSWAVSGRWWAVLVATLLSVARYAILLML